MSAKLAIFASQLGTASETFIRRHIEDLMPGATVALARYSTPYAGFWKPSCPVVYLDSMAMRPSVRLARRAGISDIRLRDTFVAPFLRRHGVNIVLGEYLDQFLDFVPLLQRMRIPYVVQGHGMDVSASLRTAGAPMRNLVYRSALAVLTRCEFHRQRLIEMGLPAHKIHVNPGGVDVPPEPPLREPDACKRFLAIGRMVPKKGPIYLLEAFRRAAAKDSGIVLDYIGDGQIFAAAQQFVNACSLQERVHLHGAASEDTKHRLLRECGVFVQHSITDPETGDEEGLPAAIQEAMANGMAVISTQHSGIPEAVGHGITGWLVGEGDTAGMANAMSCLAREPKTCANFGAAAHHKAEQLYSWPAERSRLLFALTTKL